MHSDVNTLWTDRPRRAADLPDGPRQVHRAILRHFAATGTPPGDADIHVAAAGLDSATALRVLAAGRRAHRRARR